MRFSSLSTSQTLVDQLETVTLRKKELCLKSAELDGQYCDSFALAICHFGMVEKSEKVHQI